MLKFFYRFTRGRHGAHRQAGKGADPFSDREVAGMDLHMLADLPPEQLHERTLPSECR